MRVVLRFELLVSTHLSCVLLWAHHHLLRGWWDLTIFDWYSHLRHLLLLLDQQHLLLHQRQLLLKLLLVIAHMEHVLLLGLATNLHLLIELIVKLLEIFSS